MSDPFKNQAIPRAALIGAGFLVVMSLVVTTAHVHFGFGAGVHGPGDVLHERQLVFTDQTTGGILVLDGESGELVQAYEPGDGNFVRNLMRILARERKIVGGSSDVPFRLIMREGGYLSLEDPITARSIELNAFGQDNLATFVSLLPLSNEATT